MLQQLPVYVPIVFLLATLATLLLLCKAIHKGAGAKKATAAAIVLILWLAAQGFFTFTGMYSADTSALPPTIVLLGILPAILAMVLLFVTRKGRSFISSLPPASLTYIHIVRIPVELVLYWLFIYKAVPQLMTFEGRNFDIIAGITAPVIAWYGIQKGRLGKKVLLAWNIICIGLLANIVINALLSAPTPLQQFAFNQPNIAILYFPFSWLPVFIVPVVLFAHLAAVQKLLK